MSGAIRVLELRSVRGTGGGPEKTILLGTARTDPARYAITVCYLRDRRDAIFGIDEWARDVGVSYAEVLERHSFDWAIWPALRRIVRERQIQIVHSHEYKTDLLALLLSRSDGVTPLATAHGWTGHSWRERLFYYPADKRVLARFPRLIAVSGEIRDELVRHGASRDRVTVVLNGIDARRFRYDEGRRPDARRQFGFGDDDIVIGAVGRLEPQKRFDLLMQAVVRLRATRPRLRLLIAGEGSARADLERWRRELDLEAVCQLVGHTADVPGVHHAFDLFVQSSDYEGTPNAVLEAMALRTPLVATDVGGTAELAVDGVHGLIVPPGDAGALATAIERALGDPHAMRVRANAARARVECELSFDRRMERVEAVYDDLVAGDAGVLRHRRTA
jgi:glycosyltransferase involved in cell wall biosynthesis